MTIKRFWSLFLMVSLIMAVSVGVVAQEPDSAGAQSFASSITYYTPSETGGTLNIALYKTDGSKIDLPASTLSAHSAGSVFIGGSALESTVGSTFLGSAVLSSDVSVIATVVQLVPGGAEYPRPLYSGFTPTDASTSFYVPTVLKNQFNTTSQVSIQNVESTETTVTLKFYRAGETSSALDIEKAIPANSTAYYDLKDISGLGDSFNGALVVSSAGGNIVASSQENGITLNNREAYAFEGVASGAKTVYMPSMLCNAFTDGQISYYAIQNTSLTDATTVTVTFYDTAGQTLNSVSKSIAAGNKVSVNPCNEGVSAGKSGSAVIVSDTTDVIAIGKVKSSQGRATAFVGASTGATKLAAPYIRWASDPTSEVRSFVAIMNVGNAPAENIQVKYYDGNGALSATDSVASASSSLAPFVKVNSNPETGGALASDGTFGIANTSLSLPTGGSIEVTSDQPVVVVVRGVRDFTIAGKTGM
jgi:hypothetical protein